jgi:tRNA(Ile)-lysidine synthase
MMTKIRQVIEKNKLFTAGENVLAACSGGPDSLALVHALSLLREESGISLTVAHVNHMLRGAESDADARFVAEFCCGLGLPFYQANVDVPGYVDERGGSTEDAARILRYEYLRQVARQLGGAKIAVGHHLNDQAETLLFHLFRGAGSAGLAGMRPVRGDLVRPLITVNRQEIDRYCREHDLTPRQDSTNFDSAYSRNYLRNELIPLIERRFNARLAETLARTAELAGDEHDYIETQAGKLWPTVVQETADSLIIDCERINLLHAAMRREIFRAAIAKKQGDLKGITFLHVERLIELSISGNVGSVIELPGGLTVCRGYGQLNLTTQRPLPLLPAIPAPGIRLQVPGVTAIPGLGLVVTVRLMDVFPGEEGEGTAVFSLGQITLPIYVRTRQNGDRFRPAGATGSKKLQDYFIDNKVPRQKRDQIPIFCDSQGIFWVGGYRRAQRTDAAPGGHRYLQLTITTGGFTNA